VSVVPFEPVARGPITDGAHWARALRPLEQLKDDERYVLRRIAKFIGWRGYCPCKGDLMAGSRGERKFDRGVLSYHLTRLIEKGLLTITEGRFYLLTEAGWIAQGITPVAPILPSHPVARRKHQRMLADLKRFHKEQGPL
jgi:hypothetical protein